MKQQRRLRERLRTLDALRDAVAAMKSLSAHQLRIARQALPAARGYRDRVAQCLADIRLPPPDAEAGAEGLLLVSTDLGLCGDYNTRLTEACQKHPLPSGGPIYCAGRRGAARLRAGGLTPSRTYPAAASVEGLQGLLLNVSEDLLNDYVSGRFRRLTMVSARFDGAGHFTPRVARLLPFPTPEQAPRLPLSPYVDREAIVTVAVREYLFIVLYESLLEALAAEHGMRLVATESAEQWLDRSIQGVRRRMAAQQREATTQELLDLIGGRGQDSPRNSEQR